MKETEFKGDEVAEKWQIARQTMTFDGVLNLVNGGYYAGEEGLAALRHYHAEQRRMSWDDDYEAQGSFG